jgi:hypothetical protein
LAFAAFSFLPSLAPAQTGKQVVAIAPVQKLVAHAGSTVTETLSVNVASGYHVNSDKPKDEFLIPLKLTWSNGPLQARKVTYPAAEQVKVGTDTLNVFTGTFPIATEFQVSPQATPGLAMLQGKLRYQACDNQSCKRPATLDVQIPLSIQ